MPWLIVAGALAAGAAGTIAATEEMKAKPLMQPEDIDKYIVKGSKFQMGSDYLDWGSENAAAMANRDAAFMEYARAGSDRESIAQQNQLIQSLQAQAAGKGDSAAQRQMEAGSERAIANAMALRARRGASPGMANYQAQQQAAEIGLATNRDAAMLRAQESAQARQALGQAIGQKRSQTQALNLANAQFQQQAAAANLQAQMQQQQMNDQMMQYYESQGFSREQAQLQANMALEQLKQQNAMQHETLKANYALGQFQTQAQQDQQRMELIGGMISTGGGVVGSAAGAGAAAASDKNLKYDIKDGTKDIDKFLKALKPKKYKYRGEKSEHTGVMAQMLEKSKSGEEAVVNKNGYKYIDTTQIIGPILAALGRLEEKVDGKGKK